MSQNTCIQNLTHTTDNLFCLYFLFILPVMHLDIVDKMLSKALEQTIVELARKFFDQSGLTEKFLVSFY